MNFCLLCQQTVTHKCTDLHLLRLGAEFRGNCHCGSFEGTQDPYKLCRWQGTACPADMVAKPRQDTSANLQKDGGKPFNPLFVGKRPTPDLSSKEGGEGLGLCLINNLVENISYKYMYGLNVVLIKL